MEFVVFFVHTEILSAPQFKNLCYHKFMRCFIGIDLPSSAIKEIERLQNIIKPHFTGKITESKNLHLTLKFLGEINNDTLKKVKKKLFLIKSQPFKLYLDKLGVFSKKFVKIVWVKVSNVSLQKLIDNSLADIFEKEWRFMGHITIARVKNLKNKNSFLELINKTNVNKIVFIVKEFYLKESILRKKGPVYKIISTYKI